MLAPNAAAVYIPNPRAARGQEGAGSGAEPANGAAANGAEAGRFSIAPERSTGSE